MIALRLALTFLAFSVSSAVAAPQAPAGLGNAFPQTCASGYHPDAGGNCQPAIPQTDRFCAAGTVFHSFPDGWTCDPAPPEAY